MRILALTRYGRIGASSRMRIFQYVPIWQSLGIHVEVSPLLSDDYIKRLYAKQATNWWGVLRDYLMQVIRLLRVRKFDLLWIEKELFPNLPAWFEQALNALGIRYIVDYDDAVFHNYDLNPHPAKRFLTDKIDKVMRNAALVVCGNTYLANRARTAGAHHVEIIPTVVDLERYEVLSPKPSPYIVIGWIGSPSTAKYLDLIAPVLQALSGKYSLQLRVIGAQFSWPGLEVDCRPWSEETEVEEIQGFDVGIMPLIDSPWERGKCGYKLIQCMACGKPVVASPVGVNKDIVVDDSNGYLASTGNGWIYAFDALFSNEQKRLDMGRQGRKLVEEKYCLQVSAPRLVRLLNAAMTGKRADAAQ